MRLFHSRYPWPSVMVLVVAYFLSSQTPASRGRWLPSLSVVLPEFFLSTTTSCMLRMGYWTEEKFWCNLLVSLARRLFWIGSVCNGSIWNLMNLIGLDYDCIIINWTLISVDWTVSLKCLEMWFGEKTEIEIITDSLQIFLIFCSLMVEQATKYYQSSGAYYS